MAKVEFNQKKMLAPIEDAQKALIALGYQMESEIKQSMKAGTGRVYGGHQASAPGEPPAVDTGRLRGSISTNWTGSGMRKGNVDGAAQSGDGIEAPVGREFTVSVGSAAPYASWLEYGTKKMAARPFIRPIFDKFKSKISRFRFRAG